MWLTVEKERFSRCLHGCVFGEIPTCLFCCRFIEKTKNEWEHRDSFEKVAGKYDMVFMDYSTNEKVRLGKVLLKVILGI